MAPFWVPIFRHSKRNSTLNRNIYILVIIFPLYTGLSVSSPPFFWFIPLLYEELLKSANKGTESSSKLSEIKYWLNTEFIDTTRAKESTWPSTAGRHFIWYLAVHVEHVLTPYPFWVGGGAHNTANRWCHQKCRWKAGHSALLYSQVSQVFSPKNYNQIIFIARDSKIAGVAKKVGLKKNLLLKATMDRDSMLHQTKTRRNLTI